MSANANLTTAKKVKNDEFFTMLCDVEAELQHYWPQLRNKVVYCNCDDPANSNFWRYFVDNFESIGIKKLIATHYTPGHASYMHIIEHSQKAGRKHRQVHSKMYGDGDFRNEECIKVLQEADIVVTNPPFSLFKEYISLLSEQNKQYIVIGNMNTLSSIAIFSLIKDNKMWLGYTRPKRFIMPDGLIKAFGNIVWYTNVDIEKRHCPISLACEYDPQKHLRYDNYDAINVDRLADIPKDYMGEMGVPLTFLIQQCPDQFQLQGMGASKQFFTPTKQYVRPLRHNLDGTTTRQHVAVNNTLTIAYDDPPLNCLYCTADNTNKYLVSPYKRLLIKRRP